MRRMAPHPLFGLGGMRGEAAPGISPLLDLKIGPPCDHRNGRCRPRQGARAPRW